MRIITISGSGSGAGKTTLAVLLIKRLVGFAAIKVTANDLYAQVTDDPEVINMPGKDTALMQEAGASHVVWAQGPRREMAETIGLALNMAGDAPGVIVEGNAAARVVKADIAFFVLGAGPDIKPGAEELLAAADAVVVNTESDTISEAALAITRKYNEKAPIFTMSQMRDPHTEVESLLSFK